MAAKKQQVTAGHPPAELYRSIALIGAPVKDHKSKWFDHLHTVLDSRTVRAAARRVGPHPDTDLVAWFPDEC